MKLIRDDVVDLNRVPGLSSKNWHVLTPLLFLLIFIPESWTPIDFSHGILYLVPIVVASFSLDRRLVAVATLSAVALTIVGHFISPGDGAPYAVSNRLLTLAVLLIVGALSSMAVRYFQALADARDRAVTAAAELERAQHLLRVGERAARLGGWTVDLETRRVRWSDEVAAIHELPPGSHPPVEEAIRYYAPESRQRIEEVFEACARDGIPYDEEFLFESPSGRKKWVRSIGEPIRDAEGRIVAVEGALQDVTEWRQLQESLAASQARLRQLADAMPLIVWTAAPDGSVDYVNQVLLDYVEAPRLDLPDQLPELMHPGDVARVIAAWRTAAATGQRFAIEARARRGCDGAFRWHAIAATPIRDRDGAIVRWYGSATDIHDHKQHEEELARLSERLISTLESITDGFYTLDDQWRFSYVNAEFESWLGRPKESVLGRNMWELFPHLVDLPIHGEFQGVVAHRAATRFVQYFPGVRKWVRVHAYPSDDGLSAYLEDITAQRELDEKLRQSQRLEAIGQLTGGIAHDFNNLLTVILGNTEALAEECEDEDRRMLAELAMTAAERGADLTGRLLAFARQQPLDPKVTDVGRLVLDMGPLLRRTLGEDVEVEITDGGALRNALVDPPQLENAVLNLCLNARDAMPEGGKLTVEVSGVDLDEDYAGRHADVVPDAYVVVAVSDTGTGMPPEVAAKAFDPFFTTKAVGQGSGLGLSMVYGFARQSKGHAQIYSEQGHGTTVKLYLPSAAPANGAVEAGSAPAEARGGTERILLVEDDEMVRRHVAGQLKGLGYDVTVASDGHEALAALGGEAAFDLLFTDVVMPGGIGGRDLAERARQLRPGLRVLFTSGYTEDSILRNGRLPKGVDLLHKPYRRQDLAAKLRLVLERGTQDEPPA